MDPAPCLQKPKQGQGQGWSVVPGARESEPKAKYMTRVPWEVVADFSWWLMKWRAGVRDAYSKKHVMDIGI